MAFIGILFANILLMLILVITFIAIVLFIISMILFSKNKKAQKAGKKNIKKTGAIITLVISIILFLPLIISICALSINSKIQDTRKKQIIESIENKTIVRKDEWKNGFEYDGKNLIPVNLLMNSDNYDSRGAFKKLNIGALVIENTNSYYYLYELENESGYKIYYVKVSTFTDGEYYSRTFVDKNDYEAVLNYYSTASLNVSTLWKSAPKNLGLSNMWTSLDLDISDRQDEIIKLANEVLGDISNKKQTGTSTNEDYDNSMEFEIKSSDKVFALDLVIYTKDNDIKLYLNKYEVEKKIIEKHKDMLLSLINDAQEELIQ
ncbi:MAG: hypothetical protein J6A89_04920 [Clostridia bacterium]|nr:hypothetical protein [Clostridia bacterium]